MNSFDTISYKPPAEGPVASGDEALSHVFTPLQVGGITIRNRIFSGPHGTGFSNGGVTDKLLAYHLERARGGTGLIITEATSIDPNAAVGISATARGMQNVDDSIIPSYRRLADALHAEGTKVMALLSHSGRNTVMGVDGEPPLGPSPIPMDRTRDIPHELERDEIEAIIEAFAQGALRCKLGGLDGVAISFAHGNLVQEFLSPWSNRRTDEYGGTEERRLRLAREVLERTRERIGADFVFGIRYSLDEVLEQGYRAEDGLRWLKRMVEWGGLDFVDISAGSNHSTLSRALHYPSITVPPGALVPLARMAKAELDIPVFCVGKINDVRVADTIVATGGADMVAMTRAQLAEPELVNKSREGRWDEIRSCIYCNEGCFSRQQRVGPITCVYNPRVGREDIWAPLGSDDRAAGKRVVVVGGGPGGMEAARAAAKNGHRVTLLEADRRIGGQLHYIEATPHRQAYGTILRWYQRELERHGVDVRTGTRAGAEDVLAFEPDAVIVATGSRDAKQAVPGAERPHVFTGRQAIESALPPGPVVLGDWDGRWAGTSVAEHLLDAGHEVVIVTPAPFPGVDGDLMTWRMAYARLLEKGAVVRSLEEIVEITDGGAIAQRYDGSHEEIPAVSVVLVNKGEADRELWRDLRDRVENLHAVGDCWAPRQLEQAIFEGAKAARGI